MTAEQRDLVSRIVQRTTPGEATFRDLVPHYDDLGGKDEAVYRLLLKLSLEPGKDWRSKWQGAMRKALSGEEAAVATSRPSAAILERPSTVPRPSTASPPSSSGSRHATMDPLGSAARQYDSLRRMRWISQRWHRRLESHHSATKDADRFDIERLQGHCLIDWARLVAVRQAWHSRARQLSAASLLDQAWSTWRVSLQRGREVRWQRISKALVSAFHARRQSRAISEILQVRRSF